MSEDAYDPNAAGDGPEPGPEDQDATRYPGHERPDDLRERAGLDEQGGREPGVAPEVADS
jgi:hypothetical protein